jgi:hypothetical protein
MRRALARTRTRRLRRLVLLKSPGVLRALVRVHRLDRVVALRAGGSSTIPAGLLQLRHPTRGAGTATIRPTRRGGSARCGEVLLPWEAVRSPRPDGAPDSRGRHAPERCASRRSRRSRMSVTAAISWSECQPTAAACFWGWHLAVDLPPGWKVHARPVDACGRATRDRAATRGHGMAAGGRRRDGRCGRLCRLLALPPVRPALGRWGRPAGPCRSARLRRLLLALPRFPC